MIRFHKTIIITIILLVGSTTVDFAQKGFWKYLGTSTGDTDSSYVSVYEREVIGRTYFSRKNTGFTMATPENLSSFGYKPNNSQGIGLGVSYRYATVNMQFGLFGLNFFGKDETKGKTNSFDFQTNIYKRQWVYDFVIQTYKGMYLTPKGNNTLDGSYYLRPDIRTTLVGGDFWRIMNSDRFSYRAVMTQNDWQIQSAGSLLLGSEIYYGTTTADKHLVPDNVFKYYSDFQQGMNKVKFFRIGPGAGYAYTKILGKNFFISGSITANYDFAYTKELSDTARYGKFSMSPNLLYRIAVGYNSRRWNFNASLLDNSVIVHSTAINENYKLFNQSFRITIAHRYTPTQKIRKRILSPVDTILNKVENTIKGTSGK
ncbi:MAG: DUF4421 domain-containing protein [Chitinophagaceae bacterium]|jgi:hypothetical protein|nr:DUF4421 domain-containing protein [Chitinophagaceae bacterium]